MISTLMPRFGVLSLFCLLAACQTFEDGDKRLYEQSNRLFEESLEQSQPKVAPPAAVQAGLIPPLQTFSGSAASSPRFDVAVSDMPAREFFLSLADSAGQNLLVHPGVTGDITFSLRNVTLEETLAAVRDSYGYDYRRTAYGYQIQPNQAITRTYDLNYLNIQRQGMTDTRVSSGQITTSDNTSTTGTTSTATGSGAGVSTGTGTSTISNTINASHLVTSSTVDFWAELEDVVEMMIGSQESNRVVVNPQAGLLVVRASSADQQAVGHFLAQAQRNLQRQVILETKILEVSLSDGFEAGINWSQLGSMGNAEISLGQQGALLNGPDGMGGVFSASIQVGDFTGMVQLLETQGAVSYTHLTLPTKRIV